MHDYKPLRAALLLYEFIRFAALILIFMVFSPMEGAILGKVFPFLAYLAPNALFPIMALFLLIGLREFRNYLPLYLAGKIIVLITFYVWIMVSLKPGLAELNYELRPDDVYRAVNAFVGCLALSLGDALSIMGAWFLQNKIRLLRTANTEENGGI